MRGGRLEGAAGFSTALASVKARLLKRKPLVGEGALRSERTARGCSHEWSRGSGLAGVLAGRVALHELAGGAWSLEGELLRQQTGGRPSEGCFGASSEERRPTGRARRLLL